MMKSLRFEKGKNIEYNIIKNVRNLFQAYEKSFQTKNKTDNFTVNDIRNLFRVKKENKEIKKKLIRVIKNIFEQEKENYYKQVRVGNFLSTNYNKYRSNDD